MILDNSPRQSGKTSRLIRTALCDCKHGTNVIIVAFNQQMLDSILYRIRAQLNKKNIRFTSDRYRISLTNKRYGSIMGVTPNNIDDRLRGVITPACAGEFGYKLYYDEYDLYLHTLSSYLIDKDGYYCTTI